MNNIDLIKQYADTGAILSEYQIHKLSPNLQKTYIRRRLLQAQESHFYDIEFYEEQFLPEEEKNKYFMKRFEKGQLWDVEIIPLSDEQKRIYIEKHSGIMGDEAFDKLTDELKSLYAVKRMYSPIFNLQKFRYLPKDIIPKYLEVKASHGALNLEIYRVLSDEQKVYFLTHMSIQRRQIPEVFMLTDVTSLDLLNKAWLTKVRCNFLLHVRELENANAEVQIAHIKLLLDNNQGMEQSEYHSLQPKAKKYFDEVGGYIIT